MVSLPISTHFNDVISIDVFEIEEYAIMHIIDVKERFSVLKLLPSNKTEHYVQGYMTYWLAYWGIPNYVFLDSGNAGLADQFSQ